MTMSYFSLETQYHTGKMNQPLVRKKSFVLSVCEINIEPQKLICKLNYYHKRREYSSFYLNDLWVLKTHKLNGIS